MDKPQTADEGLADIYLIHDEIKNREPAAARRLVDAITPVVRELNDLRIRVEELTAAIHRKSEDMH